MKARVINIFTNILTFTSSFIIFYLEYHLSYHTDISDHLNIIQQINNNKYPLPGHFDYFLTISVLSGFSTNQQTLILISSFVLSFSILMKKIFTEKFINNIIYPNTSIQSIIPWTSFLLIFFTLLPSRPPFQLPWPPITWLNSTFIFVLPFCVALFYYSYKFIADKNNRLLLYILLLSTIILLIKPSYLFVFVVSFPLMILINDRKITSSFVKGASISILIIILIYCQYLYIYEYLVNYNKIPYSNVKIIISPFSAWNRISHNILISSILWFGFPILIILFLWNYLLKEKLFIYALINFILGLLIFVTFEEMMEFNNRPFGSVNFIWQLLISLYILILVCVSYFLKTFSLNHIFHYKNILIIICFFYYFIAGILYLFNTLIKNFI